MNGLAIAVALLTVACVDPELPVATGGPLANEASFMDAAWKAYGRNDSPPRIEWVVGDALDCKGADGNHGFRYDGSCFMGLYRDGAPVVYVARNPGHAFGFQLAHELAHVVQYHTNGSSNHHAPWFFNEDPLQPCDSIKAVNVLIDLMTAEATQ